MPIKYHQTTDREIHDKVRYKRANAINSLKRLGFEEAYFFGETVQALGFVPLGLAGFFGTFAAMFSEVMKVDRTLSVSVFNVAMTSRQYATYAGPFGLGVKFYTSFTDGTCVITANFDSPIINDEKEKLYKFSIPQTITAALQSHLRRVELLSMEGRQKIEHLSFADYLQLTEREDNYFLKNKNSIITFDLFSTIISIFISMGVLVSVAYSSLLPAFFLQALYPDCLIVSETKPPLQIAAISIACIVVSWIFARFQKNMFTVNGVGTKLFGRSPVPDSQGYISTKWLTLFIPLVPVRSYQIVGEYSNSQDKTHYSMMPLERLNWKQVRETLKASIVGYIIFVLILVGLATAPLWKCL